MINLTVIHSSDFIIDSFRSFCLKYKTIFSFEEMDQANYLDLNAINKIDVVIMSAYYFMANQNVGIIQQLFALKIKIIVLGHYTDPGSISYFLSKGVNCYLNEREGFEIIRNAINIVNSSGLYCPYELDNNITGSQFSLRPLFTEKELLVFKCLRKEMTNQKVSEVCELSVKSIEYHRKNIIDKCGAKKLVGALDYLISSGIVPIIDI